MILRTLVAAAVAAFLGAVPLAAQSQTDWHIEKTIAIGGTGSWDYLTVDSQTHRLYVPRSTHTQVIDSETGKVIADIPGQKIAHGVAIVPSAGRGFISDGGGNGAIIVFDLKTNAVLGTLAAQPDADGIIFDATSGLVLVVSGDQGVLMSFKPTIDPVAGKIDPPITLGGAPEFLATDGAGRVFINLMDKDQVAVVDLKTRDVVKRWPVAPGGAPVGMSIDRKAHRLAIGGRKPQKLIVMSTDDGRVVADLPIGSGVDATISADGQALASCGDGTLTVASETTPGKFTATQVLKTPAGARTMGIDQSTGKIYLPTAEYEPLAPGATGRPKVKPDTFMIVVLAKGAAK